MSNINLIHVISKLLKISISNNFKPFLSHSYDQPLLTLYSTCRCYSNLTFNNQAQHYKAKNQGFPLNADDKMMMFEDLKLIHHKKVTEHSANSHLELVQFVHKMAKELKDNTKDNHVYPWTDVICLNLITYCVMTNTQTYMKNETTVS